jgi:DNA-binding transcriptional MerR regulator
METGQGPVTRQRKRTPKKIVEILERGTRILELRKQGNSIREISKILTKEAEDAGRSTRGYSYEQVRKDFWEMVELRNDEHNDAIDDIRVLCAERLEDVFRTCMPILTDTKSDVDSKMKAAAAITRANKEYAELFGAKKPQKIQVAGEDGKPIHVVTSVVLEFTNDV